MTKNESSYGIYVTPTDTIKIDYLNGTCWRLTKQGWAPIVDLTIQSGVYLASTQGSQM